MDRRVTSWEYVGNAQSLLIIYQHVGSAGIQILYQPKVSNLNSNHHKEQSTQALSGTRKLLCLLGKLRSLSY